MNAALVLMSGAVVIVGRWTQGKRLDVPAVAAVFVLALMITLMAEVDERVARGFAILVLIAVTYTYGRDITRAVSDVTGG